MMQSTDRQPDGKTPTAQITCALRGAFVDWMAASGGSVAVSTYQAGKVAMIGWDGNAVSLLLRDFDKAMGLAVSGERLAVATRNQVLLLANARALAYEYLEAEKGRYDALYLPRVAYFTSDLNIHDLAFDKQGLLAVNTRFSCLSRLSMDFHFESVWQPPFITDLVPEDRCHLNGLAVVNGEAKYVTCLGVSDAVGGWRPGKRDGGVLLEVPSGQVLTRGLSMPHSPRWHDGALYVLNSGCGELLQVDPANGQTQVVTRLPGYLRGLTFLGPFALVGLCKIRERHIFGGLPIQERVPQLLCAVAVVDLRSGGTVGMFEFTSGCEELFEIRFLPGKRRPMILGPEKGEIWEAVTHSQSSFWLRPSHEIKDGPGGSPAGMPGPTDVLRDAPGSFPAGLGTLNSPASTEAPVS